MISIEWITFAFGSYHDARRRIRRSRIAIDSRGEREANWKTRITSWKKWDVLFTLRRCLEKYADKRARIGRVGVQNGFRIEGITGGEIE